ncbi:hypothetical protein Rsub_01341 [Raphidocelis subcapitata]|uniref:Methyltransferase FkbM domain-containing protein n=1 Tax=Raphidocelis subcapitata TaxID=307507 RepID=A0A2V0NMB5_9CHLO|nr:hypothetical protein Rsub_01341 [Raphidocelis subcapitata]|eukprot:GBF88626.1 hypothetical protein Rsub_01341 [Raphidocelis subcapitata]
MGLPTPGARRPPSQATWWTAAAVIGLCLLFALSVQRRPSAATKQLHVQLASSPSRLAVVPAVPFCTRDEAEAQAAKFQAALSKEGLYTACPAHKWLGMLPGLLEPGQEFVMLDIGCNKGYESAGLFSVLDPGAGISPPAVYSQLEAVKEELRLGETRGQCNDHLGVAAERSAQPPAEPGAVTVHCFEPSSNNFRGLQALHAKFFPTMPRSRSSWFLHNAAVTNFTGTVSFPAECNTELCSLGGDAGDPSQKEAWTPIEATTVDDFAAAKGLLAPSPSRAVLLKIDTEGFDPAVLTGARRLLSQQVPSVLLFEYHNKNAWAETSLRAVALDLASSGYACYFDGAPTLTRITGCWHDSLEIRNWSNVVCAAMGTKYHRLLESLSFMAQ